MEKIIKFIIIKARYSSIWVSSLFFVFIKQKWTNFPFYNKIKKATKTMI
nr:MAG TPA: hypothetical protein [Caudoviricetes sp.]